jgi:Flp pilus assembly protein TadD
MPAMPRNRRQNLCFALGLAIALLIAYSNSFGVPFIFDDGASITGNSTIRTLWPIWKPFFPPNEGESVTDRPVLNFCFAVNYAFCELNVWGYHAGNLLIHGLNALLLFAILHRTFLLPSMRKRWRRVAFPLASAIALLWALHPMQTESVTYIIQRAESLMALFYLLTLYCVIRGARAFPRWSRAWYAAAALACLAGMASKEVMVSAPLIIFFYDRAFLAGSFREAWRRRYGLYLVMASTWIVLGCLIMGGAAAVGIGLGIRWLDYFYTQFGAIIHYLWLCICPYPLLFNYGDYLAHGFWEIVPYGIMLGALGLATVWALWRMPKVGFLGLCLFAILSPTSSVVPACVTQTSTEHRMYLPLAAVLAFLIVAICFVGQTMVQRGAISMLAARRTGVALFSVAAMLFGCLTFARNIDYQTELSIWEDTVAKAPGNSLAQANLGTVLFDLGRVTEAEAYFQKALALNAKEAKYHVSFGNARFRLGHPEEALHEYETALELNPRCSVAHSSLGNLWLSQGKVREAIAAYRKAIELAPNFAETYNSLGAALVADGKPQEALVCLRKAIDINPNYAEAHFNLGVVLASNGRLTEAIRHYQRALELKPDYTKATVQLQKLLSIHTAPVAQKAAK